MKRSTSSLRIVAAAAASMLATASLAVAGPMFAVSWFSMDCGGSTSSSGGFSMTGTIGQPDARTVSAGPLMLAGGFEYDFTAMPPACPGDVNGDNMVGLADIAEIINCWAQPASCNIAADLDSSDSIGLGDLAVIINFWGTSCPR